MSESTANIDDVQTVNLRRRWLPWVLVFAAALLFRMSLIILEPVFGTWDAFTRLWDPESLFVRHWLPLPQVPVLLSHSLELPLQAIRLIYAIITVCAALMFGLYASRALGRDDGLYVFALVSFLSSTLVFSLAPYQEGMLMLCLSGCLYFWHPTPSERNSLKRDALGSLCLCLACLCRFEAWIFALILFGHSLLKREGRTALLVAPSLLFSLAWLLTAPYRSASAEPPRSVEAFNVSLLQADLFSLGYGFTEALLELLLHELSSLFPFLFFAAPLGLLIARKREDRLGVGCFFCVCLFLLVVARIVNAETLTSRMPAVFEWFAILYGVLGLRELQARLPNGAGPILFRSVIGATSILFAIQSVYTTRAIASWYRPEAEAALLLTSVLSEELGKNELEECIRIAPREIPNDFGESAISAIFAHSRELRFDDSRLVYSTEGEGIRVCSQVLSFDERSGKYLVGKSESDG